MTPHIHLAFRFHGNFYHPYRGDMPDELGFGKDIRIIRHLIKTLDELNGRDISVRGAWDFENAFSLEQIMPAHCPDPIAGLQRRVREGRDEVQLMSYNNGHFSRNVELDSVNNHITRGWIAVSDGECGLLAAQTTDVSSGMAFCPLRTRKQNDVSRVRLNPFGTYWGKQYRYAAADTGLGNTLATTFSASDHIRSYAPSYNGRVQEFSLLITPYAGDAPSETIRHDAEAFACPYLVLNDDQVIAAPLHRSWDGTGLGEVP